MKNVVTGQAGVGCVQEDRRIADSEGRPARTRFAYFPTAVLLASGLGGALLFADPSALSSLFERARETFSSPAALREFVEGFGAWSALPFLLIQAAQVVAGPVPAGPVIVVGSAIFGFWEGLALSIAGLVAGSVWAFLLGRRFGRPLIRRLVGEEFLAKYPEAPGNSDGWWMLMVLFLPIPAGGDAACALAGLTGISLRRFVLVVAVGRLPGTALAAFAGAGLVNGRAVAPVAAGLLALVVVGVSIRYRRALEAWIVRRGLSPATPKAERRPVWGTSRRGHEGTLAFGFNRMLLCWRPESKLKGRRRRASRATAEVVTCGGGAIPIQEVEHPGRVEGYSA